MEKHRDELETFLHETLADFKMFPNRRVWHSIYNNLHPAKLWPSYLVSLLFITVMLGIGVHKNKEISVSYQKTSPTLLNQPVAANVTEVNNNITFTYNTNNQKNHLKAAKPTYNKNFGIKPPVVSSANDNITLNEVINSDSLSLYFAGDYLTDAASQQTLSLAPLLGNAYPTKSNNNTSVEKKPDLSLQYYVGSGYILNQPDNIQTDDRVFKHLNIEAGANLLYALSQKFKLKSGVQLNYSQSPYNMDNGILDAAQLEVMPTKTLAPTNEKLATNNNDVVCFNRKILEVSLPIGVEYSIIGNNRAALVIGSTVQPTYITNITAIPSTISPEDLPNVRKFNVYSSVETFARFKYGKNTYITFGPQFRYQLFSGYLSNTQSVPQQKQQNLGFRIGLTKQF